VTGLADSLRRLSDDELAVLLVSRPELADPTPATITDLASRASAPYSLIAALATLDGVQRQSLDALALLGEPSSAADVAALAFEQPKVEVIEAALSRCRVLGLCVATQVLEEKHRLYSLIPAMKRVLVAPFDLRPPLSQMLDRFSVPELRTLLLNLGREPRVVAKIGQIEDIVSVLSNPSLFNALMDRAPGGALAALVGIHDAGCVVDVDLRPWSRSSISEDLAWLFSHALLIPYGHEAAVIAREVAVSLRGGSALREFSVNAPTVGVLQGPDLSTKRAGIIELTPLNVIDTVRRIGATWSQEPTPSLKAGGVPVKDLRLTAKAVGLDEQSAARLIDIAGVAGLFVADPFTERVGPTALFDEWLAAPPQERWLLLVRSWQFSAIPVSRVVTGVRASKPDAPLSPSWYTDIDEVWRRVRIVEAISSVAEEGVPNLGDVARRAHWHGPGRWASVGDAAQYANELVSELAILGLLKDGKLTPLGFAALHGDESAMAEAASAVFPEVVSTFTIQGDGTAIAPAELDGAIASELGSCRQVGPPRCTGSRRHRFDERLILDVRRQTLLASLPIMLGRRFRSRLGT
jgi:hypothetical protein